MRLYHIAFGTNGDRTILATCRREALHGADPVD